MQLSQYLFLLFLQSLKCLLLLCYLLIRLGELLIVLVVLQLQLAYSVGSLLLSLRKLLKKRFKLVEL